MKIAREEMRETYKRINEERVADLAKRVEDEYSGRRYGAAWKVINEITGRKKSKEGLVKGKTPQERVDAWFGNYSSLLRTAPDIEDPEEDIPTVFDNLDICDEPFTIAEYNRAKSSLKRGQSGGPDNIPPDVYIDCDIGNEVLELCNNALMSSDKPGQWSYSNIVPIPKSGNLSKPANTRGISLSCTIAKIYNTILTKPLDFVFLKSRFPLPIQKAFYQDGNTGVFNHEQFKYQNKLISVASPQLLNQYRC